MTSFMLGVIKAIIFYERCMYSTLVCSKAPPHYMYTLALASATATAATATVTASATTATAHAAAIFIAGLLLLILLLLYKLTAVLPTHYCH
eukprot:19791-Heterococcus_DN1.PRE.1